MDYKTLAEELTNTVHVAGKAILDIYKSDFSVEIKQDNSPVTLADQAAEDIILKDLEHICPEIPVISEEAAADGHIPKVSERFFLVDPLDGTKEFINKRDEFTVNIGLIENNKPTFGIVYAPALQTIYFSTSPSQAHKATLNSEEDFLLRDLSDICTLPFDSEALTVVTSRSHMNEATQDYLKSYNVVSTKGAGSSLKFCLVAEGEAHIYPRLGPTMEWDTAAGHAVLNAAGGTVTREDGTPFLYAKKEENFKNPNFIAWSEFKAEFL